jgi:hypothetical protein
MKKILIPVLALTLGLTSCKESAASKVMEVSSEKARERDSKNELLPVVKFDKVEFVFGTIDEGDVVESSFEVTNLGKSDLVISNASATCGCTIPTWPKEPIKVGETAEIKVKFNSGGKRNKQSKTITLTTNTINGKEFLRIKGFVTPKEK